MTMKPKLIKSYDCDGVISLDELGVGVRPSSPDDVIITGRSIDEKESTDAWLKKHGISNTVHFQVCPWEEKTRESSGKHKANTINAINAIGELKIHIHYEDDEVQAEQVRKYAPDVKVIMVNHDNLIEMENVRR